MDPVFTNRMPSTVRCHGLCVCPNTTTSGFSRIMKGDTIANGVVAAVKQVGLKVPLVVRLEGTNVALGKKIIEESGLDVVSASDMRDGARKIVELAGGAA